MTTVPPPRTSDIASSHASSEPAGSITTSAPRPSPVSAPNSGTRAWRSGRPPTTTGQPPASATVADGAGGRVRCDDAPPIDDPAELVPEARRRLPQEQWMPSPVGLQVGAVGERDLDLHEHLPRARFRPGQLLNAQVARGVQ